MFTSVPSRCGSASDRENIKVGGGSQPVLWWLLNNCSVNKSQELEKIKGEERARVDCGAQCVRPVWDLQRFIKMGGGWGGWWGIAWAVPDPVTGPRWTGIWASDTSWEEVTHVPPCHKSPAEKKKWQINGTESFIYKLLFFFFLDFDSCSHRLLKLFPESFFQSAILMFINRVHFSKLACQIC